MNCKPKDLTFLPFTVCCLINIYMCVCEIQYILYYTNLDILFVNCLNNLKKVFFLSLSFTYSCFICIEPTKACYSSLIIYIFLWLLKFYSIFNAISLEIVEILFIFFPVFKVKKTMISKRKMFLMKNLDRDILKSGLVAS